MFDILDGPRRHLHTAHRTRSTETDPDVRPDDRIYLRSIGRHVQASDIGRPPLAVLIIEDLCWQFATTVLAARKPAPWRRADRESWRAERNQLQRKRDRIRAMARELRLVP